MLRSIAFLTILATTLVSAHIQLQYPPPINSKFDPQTAEANIDYSMTAPLFPDGSNYPCKGYNTPSAYSSLGAVATLKAGSSFEVEFAAGGATHGGGSCQFSVSYDQGKSFAVIHSVIGGCPLASTYSVPIPSGLPSATKATFAWTWFNLVGNREEYMNCAIVDIQGSSTAKSFTGPGLFRANTLGDTCITTEGKTPVFPNPGPSVAYGAGMSSSSPATVIDGCAYDENMSVTVGPSGSSSSSGGAGSGSSSSSLATPPKATTSLHAAVTTSKAAATTTTKLAATTSRAQTTTAAAQPTFPSAAPVGAFGVSRLSAARASASSRAAALSSAAPASSSSSRAAAATTTSKVPAPATTTRAASTSVARTTSSAAPAATTSASSSSSGGYVGTWLSCTSKTTFSLCSKPTGCTPMGSVASGTECVQGAIVMASRTRMARVVKRAVADIAPAPVAVAVAPLERPSAHMSAKSRLRRAPSASAPASSVHEQFARAQAHALRSSRSNRH
ncbi:uncharacterized protein RHOBADRAFT_50565 [Rhodotorula graminis WP1]|uniref:Lytic polysaccharide monooxygenase n=1 Tax=Rhodotorula graminis (strain WP1) TaxID=578459 RepID=A0A194SEV2_RHOGW|nr:uncharacterized protein RHOBADRAFT_50565 [Rhodotorula graminis WP1]KPV78046.1 hypothetical protein RHOBADRAFT_50565 [Rhodotorula graminis WP1]